MRATRWAALVTAGSAALTLAVPAAAVTTLVALLDDSPVCWLPPVNGGTHDPGGLTEIAASCEIPAELTEISPNEVSVRYRTFPLEGQPADYLPVRDAVITFKPGDLRAAAVVALVPKPPLPEERFGIELYAAQGADLGLAKAVVVLKSPG